MSSDFKVLVVIPVFDHEHAIGEVVARIRRHDVPCLLVDDGSRASCAAVLDRLATQDGVSLLRLPVNQGKGGAVMAGLREAARLGYSHALQIDADGQHDANDVPRFVAEGQAHPGHVVIGRPLFDASVPKARLYGRYATHVWVWINTLSFEIIDSMCGFRVYPLAPTLALLDRVHIGRRMDFDTEVLVRLYWDGLRIRNVDTRVHYPSDGVSHFQVWRDNVLITAMHTRLFFGMLWRLPRLLARKVARR